jgi:hypothetical protein
LTDFIALSGSFPFYGAFVCYIDARFAPGTSETRKGRVSKRVASVGIGFGVFFVFLLRQFMMTIPWDLTDAALAAELRKILANSFVRNVPE